MTASSYCACRTAALRIFVRSLVGRAPAWTPASASASLSSSLMPRTYITTSASTILTAPQWRTTALRSDVRVGQMTMLRTFHCSRTVATDAAAADERRPILDGAPEAQLQESQESQGSQESESQESRKLQESSREPQPAANTDGHAEALPPPAPATPGKNRRKKLRRRLEAEAQAEALLQEYGPQASAHMATQAKVLTAMKTTTSVAATTVADPTPAETPAPAPAAVGTVSDKRKLRKILRAARRKELKEAARKEQLADQILSRKQRQAKHKEKADKEKEASEKETADEEARAARMQRRMNKKLQGKAARRAALAENDPAKYAEIEAKRVKKEMKAERRAQRLEKKQQLEEQSKKMRGVKDDKEKDDRPMWQIQKEALKQKFPEGWKPRKKLSPDALEGIRALHKQMPETYTTAVLAAHFEVSPEAIRRILKSKWQAKPEEEEDRQMRWFERGKQVWARWAALGKKPPKQWRREGILRDASWTGSRKRAQEAREAYEQKQREREERGQQRGGQAEEQAGQDGQDGRRGPRPGARRGGGFGRRDSGGFGRRDSGPGMGRDRPSAGRRDRGDRGDRDRGAKGRREDSEKPSGPYDW